MYPILHCMFRSVQKVPRSHFLQSQLPFNYSSFDLTAPPHFLVPSQPELFLWRRFESGLPQETVCTTVYREADSGIFLGDTQCKGIPIEVIFCQNSNVELKC